MALALTGLQAGVGSASAADGYLLLPRVRLLSLPTDTAPWRYVVQVAGSAWAAPELDDQHNKANVQALAAALVYARTGDGAMRTKAQNAIKSMIPTYNLSHDSGLGPARQIAGWVLVADFIGLDGSLDASFRDLLRRALTQPIGTHNRWGGSLRACHEDSDNNWGAWCGASRIAAARYLGDAAELERADRVHRGFLGDRAAWSEFRGQGTSNSALTTAVRSWSCDASPSAYVPTNPACGDRGGAFPADASRSGAYSTFDPAYQSETTAGIVLGTELLFQAGYSRAWQYSDALARVAAFDYRHGAWNLGSVQYHWPWLINRRLGTAYPTVAARYGRSLGYTDWLYGSGSNSADGPTATPRPTTEPTAAPTGTPTPQPTSQPTPEPSSPSTSPSPTSDAPKRGKSDERPNHPHTPEPVYGSEGAIDPMVAPSTEPLSELPPAEAPVDSTTGTTTGSTTGGPSGAAPGGTTATGSTTDGHAAAPAAASEDGPGKAAGTATRDDEARATADRSGDETSARLAALVAAALIAWLVALNTLQSRRRRSSP